MNQRAVNTANQILKSFLVNGQEINSTMECEEARIKRQLDDELIASCPRKKYMDSLKHIRDVVDTEIELMEDEENGKRKKQN